MWFSRNIMSRSVGAGSGSGNETIISLGFLIKKRADFLRIFQLFSHIDYAIITVQQNIEF